MLTMKQNIKNHICIEEIIILMTSYCVAKTDNFDDYLTYIFH